MNYCGRLATSDFIRNSVFSIKWCLNNNLECELLVKKWRIFGHFLPLMSQSKRYTSDANLDEFLNPIYNELSQFNQVVPTFIKELICTGSFKCIPAEVMNKFGEILEYNMTTGKRLRPLLMIHTYRELTSNFRRSDEDVTLIYRLAWTNELLNTWSIILDDIVDDGELRRERLSWYYKKNKCLTTAFDANFLRELAYSVLDKYFSENKNYFSIFKIFNEAVLRLAIGEHIDTTFTEETNKLPLESGRLVHYNYALYEHIVHNKSTYLSVYQPLAIATIMAEKMNSQTERLLWTLSKRACYLVQAKNDFSDTFMSWKHTGKHGTDIQNGKCAWPVLKALELCNAEQRNTLELNYGRHEPERMQAVRKIFDELDLIQKWNDFEARYIENLKDEIANRLDPTLQMVFNHFLELFMRME